MGLFLLCCSGLSSLEALSLTLGLAAFLTHEFTLLTPRHDDSAQRQQAGVWAGGQTVRAPGGGRRRLHAPSVGRTHLGFNLAEEIIMCLGLQPAKLLSQVSWS